MKPDLASSQRWRKAERGWGILAVVRLDSRRALGVLGLVLMGFSLAQSATDFFTPLENHPNLLQARYSLEAAQAQLRALQSPVSLQAQGGVSFFQTTPPPGAPVCPNPINPECAALPDSGRNISLGLAFTPFPFGDIADQVNGAAIGVEQALVGYRQAKAQLEGQAIEAFYRVQLSGSGLEAARVGLRLAQANLEATKLRDARGAANPGEVRQAEANLRQAAVQVSDAERNLALAQSGLADLVGNSAAQPPKLAVPQPANPPAVRQAELNLAQARLNYDKAVRSVLPVLQGSYTRYPNATDSVGVSINSRTLQPTLNYSSQVPSSRTAPQDRIEGTLTIGLSLNLSLGLGDALEAAQKQVDAAGQALEAARRSAKLQEDSLRSALQTAEANLANANQAVSDAQKSLEEAKERERLGLASPLATLQAELALAQARTALVQADLSRTQRVLDLYRFYAVPPSEAASAAPPSGYSSEAAQRPGDTGTQVR